MNDITRQKIVNPASPEFFFEAETAYAEAEKKMMELMKDRWVEQQAQASHRDTLKEIEARLLSAGEVEGKNEAERKARLQVLLADDPEAKAEREFLRRAEAHLMQIDIDMESARSMRDLMRYRLRYADATLRYLAGIPPESPHEEA